MSEGRGARAVLLVAVAAALSGCQDQLFAPALDRVRFAAVAAGAHHTCALDARDRAYCWGSNGSGQLGLGVERRVVARPGRIEGRAFLDLDAGWGHTCGVSPDQGLLCWGENETGQLGDGTTEDRRRPVPVAEGRAFRSVSAGRSHTCALDAAGRAFCWGLNDEGQLGDGTTEDRRRPRAVSTDRRFHALAAGAKHTCGLDIEGRVLCWGRNDEGQLGGGTVRDARAPAPISAPADAFREVRAGESHTCALTLGAGAVCWGSNGRWELGTGTRSDPGRTPQVVAGGFRWSALAAGAGRWSCGLATATGGLEPRCWGMSPDGVFGDVQAGSAPAPVGATGRHPTEWRSLAAGGAHLCGVTADGAVECLGAGRAGQLGNGATTDTREPVRIGG